MVAPEHIEQLKYTDRDSFTVTAKELKALKRDANRYGRQGRLVIDFERHGIRAIIYIEDN